MTVKQRDRIVRAAMRIFNHPKFDIRTGWADMKLEVDLWKACAAAKRGKKRGGRSVDDIGGWCGECGSPSPTHNWTCPSNVAKLERELAACKAELAAARHHVKALQILCKSQHRPMDMNEFVREIDAIDAALKESAK